MDIVTICRTRCLWWILCICCSLQLYIQHSILLAEEGFVWNVTGVTVDDDLQQKLYDRYPKITSDADLAEFVEMISQMYPAYDVQTKFQGDRWEITLIKYPIITRISVSSLYNDHISQLFSRKLDYYIGKIYTQISTRRIEDSVRQILMNEGYYPNSLSIDHRLDQSSVEISVQLKVDGLCYIYRVQSDFVLPIDSHALLGQPCKKSVIDEYLQQIREYFQENYYIEFSLQAQPIILDRSKKWGVVSITGDSGPLIRYEFVWAKNVSPTEKMQQILQKIQKNIHPASLSPYLALEEIRNIWRDTEYKMAYVSEPVVEHSGSKKIYRFTMDPKSIVDLTSIQVSGVSIFNEDDIYNKFSSRKWFSFWKRDIDIDNISNNIAKLENEYRNLGYFDVDVQLSGLSQSDSNAASRLRLQIDESVLHRLQKITFDGNNVFSDQSLITMSHIISGEVLSQKAALDLRRKILDRYIHAGYLDVQVDVFFKKQEVNKEYLCEMIYRINEGKLYVFGDIFIYGLVLTKKKIVENYITMNHGEVYSSDKLKEVYQNLLSLNLFRSVKILTHNQSTSEDREIIRDIVIVLTEADHGLIHYGPGYDLFYGYKYTFEGSYNNLWGLGQRLYGRVVVEEGRNQVVFQDRTLLNSLVTLGYEYPNMWEYPLNFKTSLSRRALATDYWQFSTIMVEDFEFYLPRYNSIQLHLFSKQVRREEEGSREQTIYFLSEKYTNIFSLGVRLNWDKRDSPVWPKSGFHGDMTYEHALYVLSYDTQFDKIDIYNAAYQKIMSFLVYSLGIRWTKIWNIDRLNAKYDGDRILPITDMLLAGGSEYVRGYAKQIGAFVRYPVLAPNDGLEEYRYDVIGGTERILIKQRLRFFIGDATAVSVFYDMGNSFLSQSIQKRFQKRFDRYNQNDNRATLHATPVDDISSFLGIWQSLYSSAGLSFDYLIPIGSLKVSAAYPLHQPVDGDCDDSKAEEGCLDRREDTQRLIGRMKFDVSIAAKF